MGKPSDPSSSPLPATSLRWIIGTLAIGLLVTAGTIVYALRPQRPAAETNPSTPVLSAKAQESQAISALGRIAPLGEIFKVTSSPTLGGAKVERILVTEGARVKTGQVLAVLDNYDQKMAAVQTAQENVKVAQANLQIVMAGAKKGEIQAQQATIQRTQAEFRQGLAVNKAALDSLIKQLEGEKLEQQASIDRLQAELQQAEQDYRRYRQLAEDGAIPLADLEQRGLAMVAAKKRLTESQARLLKTEATLEEKIREQRSQLEKDAETEQLQAKEAQATLAKIAEVRPVEMVKAKAELDLALARFKEAQADLKTTVIQAPTDAQVLKIYTRPGEKISETNGLADLGKTDQMFVIAEVYETDVRRVRPGQLATIKSENNSFPGELGGQVQFVGLKVGKNDILGTDPAADVDARVVEVKIKLSPEASKTVAGLSNANVLVKIIP
ncbi:biotin/lipoyl-binding protein [Synechocystis sp. LKSZ1]|uniref:HlyD family efflux transporter periplasmic adaptor subunit n=1 Tax=Synechocystis sp. LKSZ1 TaxID=3144951 RepID=UPI00336C1529